MKAIAVVVGIVLALFPNIRYLVGLRYSVDPVLERSVCRNVACSDELLLASAERLAGGSGSGSNCALYFGGLGDYLFARLMISV